MGMSVLDYVTSPPAVLCGAGVSAASGLPTARGMFRLLRTFAPDSFARMLFNRHGAGEIEAYVNPSTPIRFEGILEVLQRFVDPNLDVLNPYLGGTRAPIHAHLAKMAQSAPVVTTNIDQLIEKDETSLPVYFTEADFAQQLGPGLWKIHGSIADGTGRKLGSAEEGAPVVTLPLISRTRESNARECILDTLLSNHEVVVVGYSGSDDFDITRWLRLAANPKHLIWIQFACGPLQVTRGDSILDELKSCTEAGAYVYDSGIRRLAEVWKRNDFLDRLTVARTESPASFLDSEESTWYEPAELTLPPATDWQKYIVTGAILKQLSYHDAAIFYFQKALNCADNAHNRAIASLELGQAQLALGGSHATFKEAKESADRALNHYKAAGVATGWSPFEVSQALLLCGVRRLGPGLTKDVRTQTKEELRAIYEANIDKGPEFAALAHEALTALLQLLRFGGEPSEELDKIGQEVKAAGLLGPKGIMAHDAALNAWKAAVSLDDLNSARLLLQDAVELREDLGDISGVCGSSNVLGFMCQRLAWLTDNDEQRASLLEEARVAATKANHLAVRHVLPFHVDQTSIGLAVLHLRSGRIQESADLLAALASHRRRIDERSAVEVEFCNAMQSLAIDWKDQAALALIAGMFDESRQSAEAILNKREDQRIRRVADCARINSLLCVSWSKGQALPDARSIEPLDSLQPTVQHARLREIVQRLPKKGSERLRICLDPLGP